MKFVLTFKNLHLNQLINSKICSEIRSKTAQKIIKKPQKMLQNDVKTHSHKKIKHIQTKTPFKTAYAHFLEIDELARQPLDDLTLKEAN